MIMHMNQPILTPPAQTEYVNGECPRPDLAKSMTVEGVEYSNLDPGCTIDFCEKCNKKVKIDHFSRKTIYGVIHSSDYEIIGPDHQISFRP